MENFNPSSTGQLTTYQSQNQPQTSRQNVKKSLNMHKIKSQESNKSNIDSLLMRTQSVAMLKQSLGSLNHYQNSIISNSRNDDRQYMSNSQSQIEDNAFVLNNYDITETIKSEKSNITTYIGSSFFDNEFYVIKRKKLTDIKDDISNKEQTLLQSCSNHENLTKYIMSFYLNKSIYIFQTATNQTLAKLLPIKNTRKGIQYFLQICRAVKYLHEKNLVVGGITPNLIFINKTKAQLSLNLIYDVNQNGSSKNFKTKKNLFQNPQYLPPEESFTLQGDVWSLGILFHEILTGLLPFSQRDGRFQVLEDCIDPFLCKILQRALRRDPTNRLKLQDMIMDLENYYNNYRTTENSITSLNIDTNVDPHAADQFNKLLSDITVSTIAHPDDETTLTKNSVKNDLHALQDYYKKHGYPQSKLGRIEIDLQIPITSRAEIKNIQHKQEPMKQLNNREVSSGRHSLQKSIMSSGLTRNQSKSIGKKKSTFKKTGNGTVTNQGDQSSTSHTTFHNQINSSKAHQGYMTAATSSNHNRKASEQIDLSPNKDAQNFQSQAQKVKESQKVPITSSQNMVLEISSTINKSKVKRLSMGPSMQGAKLMKSQTIADISLIHRKVENILSCVNIESEMINLSKIQFQLMTSLNR
eukprot:403336666